MSEPNSRVLSILLIAAALFAAAFRFVALRPLLPGNDIETLNTLVVIQGSLDAAAALLAVVGVIAWWRGH